MEITLTDKQVKTFNDKLNRLAQMEAQLQQEKESLITMAQLVSEDDLPQQIQMFNIVGNTLTIE